LAREASDNPGASASPARLLPIAKLVVRQARRWNGTRGRRIKSAGDAATGCLIRSTSLKLEIALG